RKTLCYSKSTEMLKASVRLLLDYLKYWTIPLPL
ncbi:IS1 family transposase, partial [Gloeocapsopsis sp. IPPAS B-1203]